ncbi:hypothetical protein OnM2_025069 [Erysiphe neolycopersici]|uniref:Uncharacterized protein n=1 Tax=Erysiphe neolycopersici TaxID=212602 RepID=A0A420I1D8_9PEZI|nr:hypothetical protein OnM2_025069 [Erysiphe neolycopersici]
MLPMSMVGYDKFEDHLTTHGLYISGNIHDWEKMVHELSLQVDNDIKMPTSSNQGEAFEKVPLDSLSLEEEEGEEDEAGEEFDIDDTTGIKIV